MIKEIDDKIYEEFILKFLEEVDVMWQRYQTHKFILEKYSVKCTECGYSFYSRKITPIEIYNKFSSISLPTCQEHLMSEILK